MFFFLRLEEPQHRLGIPVVKQKIEKRLTRKKYMRMLKACLRTWKECLLTMPSTYGMTTESSKMSSKTDSHNEMIKKRNIDRIKVNYCIPMCVLNAPIFFLEHKLKLICYKNCIDMLFWKQSFMWLLVLFSVLTASNFTPKKYCITVCVSALYSDSSTAADHFYRYFSCSTYFYLWIYFFV